MAQAEVLYRDAWVVRLAGWLSGLEHVVDIGAGVGAPSIPLAVLYPTLRVRLVEPRQRRATFLRYVVGALELQGRVEVLQTRLDRSSVTELGAGCDEALSRATFAPEQWMQWAAQLAPRFWVLSTELPNMPAAAQLLQSVHYRNEVTGSARVALRFARNARS